MKTSQEVWRLYHELEMTQAAIADRLGITQARVSQLLSAERTVRALDSGDWEYLEAENQRLREERRANSRGNPFGPCPTCTDLLDPEGRCRNCTPRPRSTHVITPGLTRRQRSLDAMWNFTLPLVDDATAVRIGKELMSLMAKTKDPDDPYASIPRPTDRAAATRRVANKLQGEPLGTDAVPHLPQPEDDDKPKRDAR